MRVRTAVAAAALLAGPAGCSEAGAPQAAVADVQLYAPTNLVRIGTPLQLTAYTMDVHGNQLTGRGVSWSSLDPHLASVSTVGLLAGLAPGWARIRVESEGRSDTRGFHIRPVLCSGVAVGAIDAGGSVHGQLTASGCDSPFIEGDWPIGNFAEAWRLDLPTTAMLQIDLTSAHFPAFLHLSDAALNLIASSSSGAVGAGARITTTLAGGSYLIWATSFGADRTGAYQLTVQ